MTSVEGSLTERRIVTCGRCETPLGDVAVARLEEQQASEAPCPVSRATIRLPRTDLTLTDPETIDLREMNEEADAGSTPGSTIPIPWSSSSGHHRPAPGPGRAIGRRRLSDPARHPWPPR